MIYEEPVYRPAGDCFFQMQFGDEMNMDLNFKALGLAESLAKDKVPGLIETTPSFATLLVQYDPEVTTYDKVKAAVHERVAGMAEMGDIQLHSRIVELPCCYLDPWTKAAIDDYRKRIKFIPSNPEFMVEHNNLRDTRELVNVHSTPQYWVAAIGFWPGLPFMMSLDPRYVLTCPKYNPPRTWTPPGTVGMGGSATAIYPVDTPGGYQLFGRIPVPIWDIRQRFTPFKDSAVLLRPGDRVRFIPIDTREFVEIEREVEEGTYHYNIIDYDLFSVGHYRAFMEEAKAEVAAKAAANNKSTPAS